MSDTEIFYRSFSIFLHKKKTSFSSELFRSSETFVSFWTIEQYNPDVAHHSQLDKFFSGSNDGR